MGLFNVNPHDKCRITSPFGMRINPVSKLSKMHQGIDIGAVTSGKEGDPLYAVADGTVDISKIDGAGLHAGYGYYVRINHGAFQTLYGHIQKLEVKVGQKVKAGQIIAHMGNTGSSTAAHLHFGMMQSDKWVDPAPHLISADHKESKEEEEMVEKVQMMINGSLQTVDRILKDGSNYIKIGDLAQFGVCVTSYDAQTKLVTIQSVQK